MNSARRGHRRGDCDLRHHQALLSAEVKRSEQECNQHQDPKQQSSGTAAARGAQGWLQADQRSATKLPANERTMTARARGYHRPIDETDPPCRGPRALPAAVLLRRTGRLFDLRRTPRSNDDVSNLLRGVGAACSRILRILLDHTRRVLRRQAVPLLGRWFWWKHALLSRRDVRRQRRNNRRYRLQHAVSVHELRWHPPDSAVRLSTSGAGVPTKPSASRGRGVATCIGAHRAVC